MNRWRALWADYLSYPLWLRLLLPVAAAVFITTLLTLMLRFPDNPIVLKDGVYLGKYGAVHPREHFEQFTALNRLLLGSGLALFAALFASVIHKP